MVEKERGGVERAEESRKSDLFKGAEKKSLIFVPSTPNKNPSFFSTQNFSSGQKYST